MRWKNKLPMAGALGAVIIGGVAMTAPVGMSEAATSSVAAEALHASVDGEGHGHGPERGGPRRGVEFKAVAEELGIDVDTFRDAVRAVVAERHDAHFERPTGLTAEERVAHRTQFIADVAEQLGIDAVELQAAFDAVFEARLQQGIADDRLTEAEADELRDAYANGTLPDLMRERRIESLGDTIDDLLEVGILDQSQYDALRAELDESDLEGFKDLMLEYIKAGEIEETPRPFHGRPGPRSEPGDGGGL